MNAPRRPALIVLVLIVLVLAGVFVAGSSTPATAAPVVVDLTPDAIARGVDLSTAGWSYEPGDASWTPRSGDMPADTLRTTAFTARELPRSGWNGIALFRLRIRAPTAIAGRTLALTLRHFGASEIYLDGRLLQRFGHVAADPRDEMPFNPQGRPVLLTLPDDRAHELAIRLSCASTGDRGTMLGAWLARSGQLVGFQASLADAEVASAEFERHLGRSVGLGLGFGGLFAAFGILHALLFAYYPRERGNLFFAGFAFAVTAVMAVDYVRQTGHHGLLAETALNIALPGLGFVYCTTFLAFLSSSSATSFSHRRFVAYVIAWVVTVALYLWSPGSAVADALSVILLVWFAVESLYVAAAGLTHHVDGARIIAVGVLGSLVTPITVALQISGMTMPLYGRNMATRLAFLILILSASIYLSRRVAHTHDRLEASLQEVRELSAREVEHERREAQLQVQRERERAEHQRRLKELEDARQLQLSMLPQDLPAIPSLDVFAYMKTATEVGGDYYDFHTADDGTLTVVIGDATGHGLRAGSVVTAAKSLFKAYAEEADLEQVLQHSSRVLAEMNLGSLFMALQMLTIKNGVVRIASAGMPPPIIYRAESGTIEQVTAAGPPLGLPIPWQYEAEHYTLGPGDALLLMTDGIPERFNKNDEMFGYDQIPNLLKPQAGDTAREIVEHVVRAADTWADGRAQDDDITVLVVRVAISPATARLDDGPF